MSRILHSVRRRGRTAATLVVIAGLVATAAGVQATAASWTDTIHFVAEVSAATTSTTTTTTTSTTSTTSTTTTLPPTTTTSTTTTSTTTSTTSTTTTSTTTTTTTTTLPPTTTTLPPSNPGGGGGGIGPANPNTVIDDLDWTLTSARQACTVVHVTGIDSTPRHWALRVDLTKAPWNGTPASQINLNGTGTLVIESPTSVLITGRTHGGAWDPRTNNTPITSAQTALITVCDYNAPVPPPANPSWYTVTATPSTWTDTQACLVVTATTTLTNLATNPFFYGWTTVVDLTAAKARITGAGRTLNYVSWSPYANGETDFYASPASYNPPLDSYTIRSGFNLALRAAGGGHDSKSFTVCVHGF